MIKKIIKYLLFQIPYIKNLKESKELYTTYAPPGHFLSPIPDIEYIKKHQEELFSKNKKIEGIDFIEEEQLALLNKLKKYYKDVPFKDHKIPGMRYYFENNFFSYGDGILLYCMMRSIKPKKIYEIGSGFSSALMLDVNDLFFSGHIDLKFIEPFPKVLFQLLNENDAKKYKIIQSEIQDVDFKEFDELEENDILFIDSTHIAKTGSDVCHNIFEILPRLKKGVIIHIHDIFFPFEYHKNWVMQGRAWNEVYFVRAFLMYNDAFKILLFNTFLEYKFEDWFLQEMPLCLKNPGGGLWLKKIK